jgi:hypothetical protein
MSAFTRVLRFSLTCQRARQLPRMLLLAAPLAGYFATHLAEGTPTEGVRAVAETLDALLPALLLAGLALGCSALRGERGEDSLRSVLLSPNSRASIVLGAGLAAMLVAFAVATLASLVAVGTLATQRSFGDIAPDGFFITTAEVVNAQAWKLAPLFLAAIPVAVALGLFASTVIEDGLLAFLAGVVVLFVPLAFAVPEAVPHDSYGLAHHALHVLGELGCGRTEFESLVDRPAYILHQILFQCSLAALAVGASVYCFQRQTRA